MGIDFGTAYTKVAIRLGSTNNRVLFVPWDGVRGGERTHFLPGEVSVGLDDCVFLGRSADARHVASDLKLPFILGNIVGDDFSRERFGQAVAFVAWVMRYSRAWLYEKHSTLLANRRLAWEVNLGCPSQTWEAATIRFSYETLALQAWKVSQLDEDITHAQILEVAGNARPSADEVGLDALHLMPEFIAQIAGYVRSPQKREGLHLLMDVGAGTLDLATFNVTRDVDQGGDRYPIFTSKVLPLGTHFLIAGRHAACGIEGRWDDMQKIANASQWADELRADARMVEMADAAFEKQLSNAIHAVLSHTHERRYGKAPEWLEGLPAFVAGGGSSCNVYLKGMEAAFRRHGVRLKRTHFPLLEEASTAEGVGEESFHRLSVAYGLTFDTESVGRILAPQEVDDAPRRDPALDSVRERPDRDDLYPK